jgi:hypothetical protein
MQEDYKQNGPVVIGGIGGSGTRVVAEIVSEFGFYLGTDLNESLDNLWYTLLFKRPKWYYTNHTSEKEIYTGLGLLTKVMLKEGYFSLPEWRFLIHAVVQMSREGHNHLGSGRGRWPFIRMWRMLVASQQEQSRYVGWGWKEPNAHLLIRSLAGYFKQSKYIHTMRHGLDMAFSKNQQQLFNWGHLYGVDRPKSASEIPVASYRYWVRANQRALEAGAELGREQFLLLNFDRLCRSPESEIQAIVSFLGVNPTQEAREKVSRILRQPPTMGRYRDHDLSQFGSDELSALQTFGFGIE